MVHIVTQDRLKIYENYDFYVGLGCLHLVQYHRLNAYNSWTFVNITTFY